MWISLQSQHMTFYGVFYINHVLRGYWALRYHKIISLAGSVRQQLQFNKSPYLSESSSMEVQKKTYFPRNFQVWTLTVLYLHPFNREYVLKKSYYLKKGRYWLFLVKYTKQNIWWRLTTFDLSHVNDNQSPVFSLI